MMTIQNYEANLVKWYRSIGFWARAGVAFGLGVLVGWWIF